MTFSLTKLLREPRATTRAACELCALPIEGAHGHVVDTTDRRLLCTCYACGLLFASPGAARGRFKVVPSRYAAIPAPLLGEAQWEALAIPIGLAFFFENGSTRKVSAFYPGPAGATESQLPLDAWRELREREPLIASMLSDVEAALFYRPRTGEPKSYVVPIDACYELTGLVRSKWEGVGGGPAVDAAIDGFFARIAERAA
jgi:hypothetical protein